MEIQEVWPWNEGHKAYPRNLITYIFPLSSQFSILFDYVSCKMFQFWISSHNLLVTQAHTSERIWLIFFLKQGTHIIYQVWWRRKWLMYILIYISITNMSRAKISFFQKRDGVSVGIKNFKYWIQDLFVWLLCDILALVFFFFFLFYSNSKVKVYITGLLPTLYFGNFFSYKTKWLHIR